MAYYLIRFAERDFVAYVGEYYFSEGMFSHHPTDGQFVTNEGIRRDLWRFVYGYHQPIEIDEKTFNILKDNALKIDKMREMWLATAKALFEQFSGEL